MISEEDSERLVEAKKCGGCVGWLKHCKAECCRIVYINVEPSKVEAFGKYLNVAVPKDFSMSDRTYYLLRDVPLVRGFLRFQKDRIHIIGRQVVYIYDCKFLEGNLCKGHPDNKPDTCKFLTMDNLELLDGKIKLTDNCLFRYK